MVLTQALSYGKGTTGGVAAPGSGNVARDFFVPKPGILVGRVPSTLDARQYEYVEINLTVSPPTAKKVAPFTSQASTVSGSTNILVTNSADFYDKNSNTFSPLIGVTTRSGNYAVFSTSDDRSKVLFSTRDTTESGGPFRAVYSVNLLNLADSSVERIYTSENILDTALPFRPRFVRAASSYTPEVTLTGAANAVVWGELLPVNDAGSTPTLFYRPFVAAWGSGATTAHELRTLAFASLAYTEGPAMFADSAAGKAVVYLSSTAEGRFDLEQGTFDGASTRVMGGVTGFATREDKAKILVERDDGVLYVGALSNGVSGLTPILSGLPTLFAGNQGNLFGFTPDGGHLWALVDVLSNSLGKFGSLFEGTLLTMDLATGARINWGRINLRGAGSAPGFLDGAKVMVATETFNRNTLIGHLTVASSTAPMHHQDTLLAAPQTLPGLETIPTVDGTELLVGAGGTGAVRLDKSVLPLTDIGLTYYQAATYSPYGGPYLPEWSIFSSTVGGTYGSRWKRFGGATADPLHTIANNLPLSVAVDRSRFTPDRAQFLLNGSSTPGGSELYLMAIDGPAKVARKVPVE